MSKITTNDLDKISNRWGKKYGITESEMERIVSIAIKVIEQIEREMISLGSPYKPEDAKSIFSSLNTIVHDASIRCYYIGFELASGRMRRDEGTPYMEAAFYSIDEFLINFSGLLYLGKKITYEEGVDRVKKLYFSGFLLMNDLCVLGIENYRNRAFK